VPDGDGVEPLLGLAPGSRIEGVQVDAIGATVQDGCSQADEVPERRVQLYGGVEGGHHPRGAWRSRREL
jgi:hypothetical protein